MTRFGTYAMGAGMMLAIGTSATLLAMNSGIDPLREAAPVAAPALQSMPEPTPSPIAATTPVEMTAPAANPDFVVKRILDVPSPFTHGDHVWDDAGVPDGPIVITVDLQAQVLSVFRGGHEIGAAVILYGADEKPTPTGIYPITEKDADHVSNLYDAPMPYMLRLTNDGISIHGSDVEEGAATHGCIGVPTAFARKLFGTVKLGDRVIVTNGETMTLGDSIIA